eukprot:TRINITY_DN7864_c0_g1_i3.p1 TRINITY_DN7864_c0_g1~~TRINITY_DN7864_c0_g1_i3.p1  ORF type:complete len:295 (-),score=32.80 TRINITY_DN7864_c0_g1_i3:16-900(-)
MLQYYRHVAASDFAIPNYTSYAISGVILSGIVAAIAGPEVAFRASELIPHHQYAASYFFLSGINVFHAIVLCFIPFPQIQILQVNQTENATVDNQRPLKVILKDPNFQKAVSSAAIIHLTMLGLMTITPVIITSRNIGFSISTGVIQSHLIGMFVPSIFTGILIGKYGTGLIIGIGLVLSTLFQLSFLFSVENSIFYYISLAGIGVGWNFGFIGATTLLSTVYNTQERVKVQTLNDFLVFGFGGIVTLCAGYILDGVGQTNTIFLFSICLFLIYSFYLVVSAKQHCSLYFQKDG